MTTICANKLEMAADRQVTNGSNKYHTDKIFEIRDSIVGAAGSTANTTKFLSWFRRECPEQELIDAEKDEAPFEALVLNARGLWYYTNLSEPDEIDDPFYAIGSGCDHALTAMAMGASPADAVRAAHRFDANTGEEVDVLPVPVAKRKRAAKPKIDEPTPKE